MEKLIELLNERLSTSDLYDFYDKIYYKEYCWGDVIKIMARIRDKFKPTGDRDADMTHLICLKKYEFIKWLVDNNKIDDEENNRINRRKVCWEDKHWKFRICKLYINCAETEEDLDVELFDDYERLLMHLAIQDEPIDFLCSILK